MLIWLLCTFFCEVFVQINYLFLIGLFAFLLFSLKDFFIHSGHIFFLIRYVICKYFLPICGLPLHSLNSLFEDQMFSILIKFNLSIFSFMYYAFRIISKKSLPSPKSCRFFPMVSRSFVAFHFTFKMHFGLIFKYGAKFIILHMDIQLLHHHYFKRLSFSNELPLHLCQKLIDRVWMNLFMASLISFTDLSWC